MDLKRLEFVGSSREDLKEFPKEVRQEIGYVLHEAQKGIKPAEAKPLRGFGSAGVLEIIENFFGNAYRAVYTVKLGDIVYILHCFQKKSKHGIETPKHEIDLIKQRLRLAQELYNSYREGDDYEYKNKEL